MHTRHAGLFGVLFLLTPCLLGFTASATGFELGHDDGSYDYGWSDFYPLAAAVRFSPPSTGWRLKSIRFYGACFLRGQDAKFYVQVWDRNFNTAYHSSLSFYNFFKRNATLDWYSLELPNVVVTGDFYVAIVPCLTLDGPQLWIGVDSDLGAGDNSFVFDVNKRYIIAPLNSTSRPGDFMIRATGEPVPPPPEVRLSSVEFNEGESIVGFTFPGSIERAHARLVRIDGTEVEQDVTLGSSGFTVRVIGSGVLNVYVVTSDSDIVGTSVRLGGNLSSIHEELLANYTLLELRLKEAQVRISSLEGENSDIKLKLRDAGYVISSLQKQVDELMGNVTTQREQIAGLSESLERLEGENSTLRLLLVLVVVAAVLTFVYPTMRHKVRR